MNGSNERIVRLLKQAKTFYFTTVDGNIPNVRPYNAVMEFDGKVYFYTNNHKNACKQMKVNPMVEICTAINEDRWIRINGKVVFEDRVEVKTAMLNEYPELRNIYSENDKIFEVFYLSNMSAIIHSNTDKPEVIC